MTQLGKVLIANRGAIATRIIRTLQAMDVPSVAVYAVCDSGSLHARIADESVCLNPETPEQNQPINTYMNIDRILKIARETGAVAVHPGYGFLSENAEFVDRCEEHGLIFIGPTSEHIAMFGLKHKARILAMECNIPLLPGSQLLPNLEQTKIEAKRIGYPVMLKSTAGGGGIGITICFDEIELEESFEKVKSQVLNNFGNDGVFVEKFIQHARHIEVQAFGDGRGQVLIIGERDCSCQRRNQKVVEECPAPNLAFDSRQSLYDWSERLLAGIGYQSAGTVEYILDIDTGNFYFLEVNTRLQVEHGVTEEVFGIDIVKWMLVLAFESAEKPSLDLNKERERLKVRGHSIEVRVYAEDPYLNFRPASDQLTEVDFYRGGDKENVRVETWIEAGIHVPPDFDPMLAKLIVHTKSRMESLSLVLKVIKKSKVYGCENNLDYLELLLEDNRLKAGEVTTSYLDDFAYEPARIDVVSGGAQTTVQNLPGRTGHWSVGVPPSGPFDSNSFRLANRLLDNDYDAAGLEIALYGPTLLFSKATTVVLAGAQIDAVLKISLDNREIIKKLACWHVYKIPSGSELILGNVYESSGARTYLAIAGGIRCPEYLGSRATFTLGNFGGHNGRCLRSGDVVRLNEDKLLPDLEQVRLPKSLIPNIFKSNDACSRAPLGIRVTYGPHGSPDFFTERDMEIFFSYDWEVHYNSNRTGVRLIGPKPEWARKDGGEAGLHPSNLHDNAYAFGTVDFTGDMPVILGPDGPSLGGFVCPATVITADLWKLGQLRAGDKIHFIPVSLSKATELEAAGHISIKELREIQVQVQPEERSTPIMLALSSCEYGDDICYRKAGDKFLLIEYGQPEINFRLRLRVHALMEWLKSKPVEGVHEMTPGIRSLQLHYDSQILSAKKLIDQLLVAERSLSAQLDNMSVPSRTLFLPMSWDDHACRSAVRKYDQAVRKDAPWFPDNIEFIRRINGLNNPDDVKRIIFDASYLVLGLGDVYLGAPVAVPIDPRHRLVTTKYNPARTWTAENSVGIGGSYLCVYGMEGPGGYQLIGRTLQMWNRFHQTNEFSRPYLLRFFDQIRFYEVSHDELCKIRRDFPIGQFSPIIVNGTFNMSDYQNFLDDNRESTERFMTKRKNAFDEELNRWHHDGQFQFSVQEADQFSEDIEDSEGDFVLQSPVSGLVWRIIVKQGEFVEKGAVVMVLESMKMEIEVHATFAGVVAKIPLKETSRVSSGQTLMVFSCPEASV